MPIWFSKIQNWGKISCFECQPVFSSKTESIKQQSQVVYWNRPCGSCTAGICAWGWRARCPHRCHPPFYLWWCRTCRNPSFSSSLAHLVTCPVVPLPRLRAVRRHDGSCARLASEILNGNTFYHRVNVVGDPYRCDRFDRAIFFFGSAARAIWIDPCLGRARPDLVLCLAPVFAATSTCSFFPLSYKQVGFVWGNFSVFSKNRKKYTHLKM